jgi:thiamine-phosphate pyrophosphorylase
MQNDKCKIYLISPPKFEIEDFSKKLEEALATNLVAVFQLRIKDLAEDGTYTKKADEQKIIEIANKLKPILKKYNVPFILNDNPKLAKQLGADGVHLGDEDMSVKEARELLGETFIIGASCYASKDKAYTAGEEGANYVAFGAFYETQTKKPKGKPTLDLLKFWSEYTTLPSVAIGGIKPHNTKPIADAGADFIAVVTGVWDYEKGVAQAILDYQKALNN